MKSYLLSSFVRTHAHLEEDMFRLSEPSCWLVWEAGPWKPGGARTLTAVPPKQPGPTAAPGVEALAYALAAKDGQQIALGRGTECEISINDGTISTQHLAFVRMDGVWMVADSGSRNGSTLNGAPLVVGKPKPLMTSARIMAGSVAFSFYEPKDMLWRLKQYR